MSPRKPVPESVRKALARLSGVRRVYEHLGAHDSEADDVAWDVEARATKLATLRAPCAAWSLYNETDGLAVRVRKHAEARLRDAAADVYAAAILAADENVVAAIERAIGATDAKRIASQLANLARARDDGTLSADDFAAKCYLLAGEAASTAPPPPASPEEVRP